MPAPRLAKLTRPRTEGLVPRLRLFEAMDAACARPVVWVASPPGAGKTSLLSSYLEARGRPCLWYQADSGDADPATFFYYLGVAAAGLPAPQHEALPLLTEEFAADLEPFARRFFRSLWAQLGEGGVLVLDNYQEVPAAAAFHAAVRAGAEELPEGLTLCAVSRTEPPAEFARLRANQRLSAVGWDELKLTAAETAAIASPAAPDEPTLALLCEQSGGWAAGVVLMLERLRQAGGLRPSDTHENLETIFEYFAGQVFHGATRETQEMLLRMAQLPRLTAETAQVVTGNPQAGKLLANLAKRNLFTDRRVGEQTSYQFHALFREFLRAQARERLGAGELERVAHSAAALLQATGQVEEAFALFVEEGAWDAAAEVLKAEAEGLVSQGRRETVRGWLDALPAGFVAEDGWLLLWRAMVAPRGPTRATIDALAHAYDTFTRTDDRTGQAAAAVAAVDAIYGSPDPLTWLDPWIPRLREAVSATPRVLDAEWHARAASRHFRASFSRDPLGPKTEVAYRVAWAVLGEDVSVVTKHYVAGTLLVCHWILGYPERTEQVVASMRGVPVPPHAVHEASVRLYRYFLSFYGDLRLDALQVAPLQDLAPEREAETVIGPFNIDLARMRAHALIVRRRYAEAQRLLDEAVAPTLSEVRTNMRSFSHGHFATCALAAGRRDRAIYHVDEALRVLELGASSSQLALVPYFAALLACCGQSERGATLLATYRADYDIAANDWLAGRAAAMAALIALQQGRLDDALGEFRIALGRLKNVSFFAWIVFPDPAFDHLFALALAHGIETEFVAALIRDYGIPAPDPDLDLWPWPLRLRLLGGLRIEGLPGPKSGKSQRKLNELLTAIAVAGPEGAGLQALADRLWPDSDGDAALNTLQVSLYRLRKMLGRDDAIQVADAVVRLMRPVCWVDTWAFEAKAAAAMALAATDTAFVPAASQALALYAGHLLAQDDGAPWVLPVRDRLRRAWGALAEKLGQALENAGQADDAVTLYESCLDRDSQAEAFCRNLMRCHAARGDAPAVTRTYERCRSALAGPLGVEPAAETRRRYREALQEADSTSRAAAPSGAVSGL